MDQNSAQGAAESADQSITASDVLQQGTITTDVSQEGENQSIEAKDGENKQGEKKVEEKVEEKKEEKQEEGLFSAKFAALSRKEKALKKKERELEARMAELETKMKSSAAPKEEQVQEPLELRLKKDPFNTLKELGLGYDVLTNIALNDGKLTPEIQMQLMEQKLRSDHERQIQEIKEQLAKKEADELQRQHNERVENFKLGITNFIQSNKNDFELLSVEGEEGTQLVFDVMDEHYKETEEVLDLKSAAELVENYLLEEAKKRVGLSKVKKLLGASEEKPQQVSKPEQKKQSVTLTNSQSQQATTGRRELSEEEHLMEAAKLIRWNE